MQILKIFLILVSLSLFLNADDDHHYKKYKHTYKNLGYLKLDKSQKKEIKSILLEYKYKYKEFYEYKDDQEDLLEDIMEDDNFNKEIYFKTLIDLKTKAAKLEVEKMSRIHKILDEDQREKFADYLKEWRVE